MGVGQIARLALTIDPALDRISCKCFDINTSGEAVREDDQIED
jgi:hypothetical protein